MRDLQDNLEDFTTVELGDIIPDNGPLPVGIDPLIATEMTVHGREGGGGIGEGVVRVGGGGVLGRVSPNSAIEGVFPRAGVPVKEGNGVVIGPGYGDDAVADVGVIEEGVDPFGGNELWNTGLANTGHDGAHCRTEKWGRRAGVKKKMFRRQNKRSNSRVYLHPLGQDPLNQGGEDDRRS